MSDGADLAATLGIPGLWARLLLSHGVRSEEDYARLVDPGPLSRPEELPDLDRAAALITSVMAGGRRIRVHGDYDADGVTATALLVRVLRLLGANVDWWIPNRFDDGYGLHPDAIVRAAADGVELIVTVDCGSSSAAAAERARAAGIGLIITDHHRIPTVWPSADAFVNPERMETDRPILSGAGVALQLGRFLLGDDPPPSCWGLAALGAVADVMPMRGDTRVIVRRGLRAISGGQPVGLRALQRVARRDLDHVSAQDLGFSLAPRINAAGRLGSPEPALLLALTDAPADAERLAAELEVLNQRRRTLADQVLREAEDLIARRQGVLPSFLVVAQEGWHEGVVGIAAGRLSDRYGRPAAVVTKTPEQIKGSARGGRYGDVLKAFEPHRDRFLALGGHRGAAGFTLRPEGLAGLEAALSASFAADPVPEGEGPVLEALPSDINQGLGEFLLSLEPFGPGLPAPRFRLSGEIERVYRMGQTGQHARFRLRGAELESVGFGYGPSLEQVGGRRLDGEWTLESNWWQGRQRFEMRLHEVLWPPIGKGGLGRHRWEMGCPPVGEALLVVAASRRRALKAAQTLHAEESELLGWWQGSQDSRTDAVKAWTPRPIAAVYIVDGPPHRWALEALLDRLPTGVVVHWEPSALHPEAVLKRWARLVPDADRLRNLWRARRDHRSPLVPGRRVLEDLGLHNGDRPERRRELQDSSHFRTAWVERRTAERDWASGGPWTWREEEQARGLAE